MPLPTDKNLSISGTCVWNTVVTSLWPKALNSNIKLFSHEKQRRTLFIKKSAIKVSVCRGELEENCVTGSKGQDVFILFRSGVSRDDAEPEWAALVWSYSWNRSCLSWTRTVKEATYLLVIFLENLRARDGHLCWEQDQSCSGLLFPAIIFCLPEDKTSILCPLPSLLEKEV